MDSRAGPSSYRRYQHRPRESTDSAPNRSIDGIGLSALAVCLAAKDGNHRFVYVTPSIRAILGYEPEELIGKNHMSFYHPEEMPFIYPAYIRLQHDQTLAMVSYHRERHKKGYWVDVCVQAAVVYDQWVGIISRQPEQPVELNPAHELISTARDIIEANLNMSRSGLSVSKWHMDPATGPRLQQVYKVQTPHAHVSSDDDFEPITEEALLRVLSEAGLDPDPDNPSRPSSSSTGRSSSSSSLSSASLIPSPRSSHSPQSSRSLLPMSRPPLPSPPSSHPQTLSQTQLRSRRPRTAFFINRFTQACTVEYVSNCLVVNALPRLLDKPFFCIVRPSDRGLVRTYIERAKEAGPVVKNEEKGGTHGFCRFSVLKIPDFPPLDQVFPLSTDEDERSMPGQEFIPVEAVFTAGSDGVLCVIERLSKGDEVAR